MIWKVSCAVRRVLPDLINFESQELLCYLAQRTARYTASGRRFLICLKPGQLVSARYQS